MRDMLDSLQRIVQDHYSDTYRRVWVQWTRDSKGRGEYSLLITVFPNGVDAPYRMIRSGMMSRPTEESALQTVLDLIDGEFA